MDPNCYSGKNDRIYLEQMEDALIDDFVKTRPKAQKGIL
jgi:hypothetical protein